MDKVYLITLEYTDDNCCIGVNFFPEVYTEEERANKRLTQLQEEHPEVCGYYYCLHPITLDTIPPCNDLLRKNDNEKE